MQIKILKPDHFNFLECLWYLDRNFDECLYTLENKNIYKAVHVSGQNVLLNISDDLSHLIVNVDGQVDSASVEKYVRNWFDLDRDLSPFYAMAGSDNLLAPLVTKYHGLRMMRINDLFEALCWSVIGQQINLKFAYKLKRAMVEKYGSSISVDGDIHLLFPSPDQLSGLQRQDLLDIQFSRQKADYIINLAKAFTKGELAKSEFTTLNISEAVERLCKLKGIGPWTANYAAMRCLGFVSAFPAGDAGLQNAIKALTLSDHKPTMSELSKLSERWDGWQAYATLFLWRSLSEK